MNRRRQNRRGLAKLFLSSKILPWVLCDFLISFLLFDFFAGFGKGAHLDSVRLENLLAATTLSSIFCVVGVGLGFFERENRSRKLEIVKLGVASWLLALALGIAVMHFLFFIKVGRFALVYGSLASIVGVVAFHVVMAKLLRKYPQQFVFLGPATPTAMEISRLIDGAESHLEYNRDLSELLNTQPASAEVLESELAQNAPLDIVLTSHSESDKHSTSVATIALQKGLRVIDEGSFYAEIFRRYPIENLSTHWIVRAGFDIQKPITNFIKRLLDLMGVFVLGALLLIPMILAAILIKLSSPGPVFYVQTRQGRHSKPFRMIKFRSMMERDSHGSHATPQGDARITSMGKLMRPLHFDELPQMWNILRGEMSFVGPRPESLEIVQNTKKELPIFEIRHMVRPGLTGWAQINQGKTSDGLSEVRTKLSYDLYYAKNYSLVLDLLIALRTLFVLTKKAW